MDQYSLSLSRPNDNKTIDPEIDLLSELINDSEGQQDQVVKKQSFKCASEQYSKVFTLIKDTTLQSRRKRINDLKNRLDRIGDQIMQDEACQSMAQKAFQINVMIGTLKSGNKSVAVQSWKLYKELMSLIAKYDQQQSCSFKFKKVIGDTVRIIEDFKALTIYVELQKEDAILEQQKSKEVQEIKTELEQKKVQQQYEVQRLEYENLQKQQEEYQKEQQRQQDKLRQQQEDYKRDQEMKQQELQRQQEQYVQQQQQQQEKLRREQEEYQLQAQKQQQQQITEQKKQQEYQRPDQQKEKPQQVISIQIQSQQQQPQQAQKIQLEVQINQQQQIESKEIVNQIHFADTSSSDMQTSEYLENRQSKKQDYMPERNTKCSYEGSSLMQLQITKPKRQPQQIGQKKQGFLSGIINKMFCNCGQIDDINKSEHNYGS